MRIAPLVLLLLASAARADHLICLAADGVFRPPAGCIEQERPAPVPAAEVDRKFAYINRSANSIILGILPAHATDVDLWPGAMMAFGYDLEGTAPGTVVFGEERLGSWSVTLDGSWFADGRLNVHLPDGTFDYSVTRGGKVLDAERGRRFRSVPRPAPRAARSPGDGRVTLSGRAVAPDGTAADFAVITADCKREVCTANANGTFRCITPLPVDRSFCIEHPSGRKRVELEGRTGAVDLATVQLVAGGTIRVVKPPHVELPEGATVSLLHKQQPVGEPQPIGARALVEFEGVNAGRYDVLLAGNEPLQRKLFPVEIGERGETELLLSLEPYRLTGEVEYREKPLAGASVGLDGPAWQADLKTDQSGRFGAELWSPDDYMVLVEAPELAQPYLIMERARPSDAHWRLTIPSRRIAGRIFDAESGKSIPNVQLLVESESGETRANRSIDTKEDGTFEYPGAGDGQYVLSASAPDYLPSERVELQAREGDGDLHVDLPLLRGVQVRVTAVDPRGAPVAGATVVTDLTPSGTISGIKRTDEQGVVTIPIAEKGQKTIYILPPKASFALAQIRGSQAASGVQVVVPDGVATLHIRARSVENVPVVGVGVMLRYAGAPLPASVLASMAVQRRLSLLTDAAGEFMLPALPAGRYEIAWTQRGRAGGLPGGWTPVELGAAETLVTQTFDFGRGGTGGG